MFKIFKPHSRLLTKSFAFYNIMFLLRIFQLVELKAEEMRDLRGLRTQEETQAQQQTGPATRQRRSGVTTG